MAGGGAALALFLAAIAALAVNHPLFLPHGVRLVVGDVLVVGIAALPVGMGVAILKYRLYEIGRIISRTLAYAIVTGLLVGVYAGLVLLATEVFSVHRHRCCSGLHAGRRRRCFIPCGGGCSWLWTGGSTGPVRRGPDRGRIRGSAEGCRGTWIRFQRPDGRGDKGAGTRPYLCVAQPAGLSVKTDRSVTTVRSTAG